MGDPAEIKAKRVKKQKFDREDARLLLRLMRENNFPQIWVRVRRIGICDNFSGIVIGWCSAHANHESVAGAGDERGLSLEEKTIQRTRTSTVRETPLAPWASRRRQELLELLDRMNPTIEELTAAAEREARKRPEALRLMTQEIVEQHVMSRETADLFDSIIDSACFQTH